MLARNFALNRVRLLSSVTWLPDWLPKLLLFLSLAGSNGLYAQGLGELTLESALNEPLRASIELLNVAGLDPNQVVIRLASPEEYEQAGLDYSSILTTLDLATSIPATGNGVTRLSSEQRVDEPYLSLLVSARWPAGRVMREYTVLLDLPGRGRPAQASLPVSEPRSTPAPAPAQQPAAAPAAPTLAGADSYTVNSGDSLWVIAEQTRPSTVVTVPQMMIAIQRANEDAFVNNDINRLLTGRVLRIPAQNEIATVDVAEALALVNAPRPAGATPLGAPGSSNDAGVAGDELSVLTNDDAADTAGSSDLEATIAALENSLLLSEEELDRARLENEELTMQLGELEEQIAILQNIIAIEDERLAGLQEQLGSQAEATAAALTESEQATRTLASQAPAPEQGLLARLMQLLTNNLIALGVALVLVLLVLGFLVQRARQARLQEEDDDDLDFDTDDDDDLDQDDDQEEDMWALGESQDQNDPFTVDDDDRNATDDFIVVEDMDDMDDEAEFPYERKAAADDFVVTDSVAYDDDNDAEPEIFVAPAAVATDEDHDSEMAGIAESEEAAEYALRQEIDDSLDEIELQTDADDDADISEEVRPAVPGDDEVVELEFESSGGMADDGHEGVEAESSVDTESMESFEFKLDVASQPEAELAENDDVDDLETFDFNFDTPAATEPEPAAAEPASEEDMEVFDFNAPAADKAEDNEAASIDMGNFTFDESDIKFDDEEEAGSYTPRTNMDECDTKLDLAVAYEAMGDVDGAVEILDEVIAEGKPQQVEEAQRLKSQWQGA